MFYSCTQQLRENLRVSIQSIQNLRDSFMFYLHRSYHRSSHKVSQGHDHVSHRAGPASSSASVSMHPSKIAMILSCMPKGDSTA